MLSVSASAQNTNSLKKACDACRPALAQGIIAEAKKLKLELDEKALTVISGPDLLSAFIPVAGGEKMTDENFQKGITVGLLYIESANKARIPNGYYRVQLGPGPRNSNKETREKLYTLSLVDWDGKVQVVTDTLPQAYINYRDRVLYMLYHINRFLWAAIA